MRRQTLVRLVGLLALVMTAGACEPPAPPPVSQRQPSLEAGDLAVIKGLLDDHVRPRAGAAPDQLRVLVVDTTLADCERDVTAFGSPPGGCLAPMWLDRVRQVLPPATAREAMLDFEARNRRRLPIGGSMGDGVSSISATATDFVSESDLLGQRPGVVVSVSAPSYPAPHMAVIAYAVQRGEQAAARLEQQQDGLWRVVANASHPQD